MSVFRRWWRPGGTYFFVVVTHCRRGFLTTAAARRALREAMEQTSRELPFEVVAIVLLPEHLHCVWALPADDADFATRWRLIKSRATRSMMSAGLAGGPMTASRRKRGEQAFWQRRYWEHLIRDETDLKRHVDYVHYNPVKHGHVQRAADWPYSTFKRFMDLDEYTPEWGQAEPENLRGWNPPYELVSCVQARTLR